MSTSHFKPCLECGGQRVEVPLHAYVGIMYSVWGPTPLRGLACLNCGNTTLYTDTAQLRKSVEKHQQQTPL